MKTESLGIDIAGYQWQHSFSITQATVSKHRKIPLGKNLALASFCFNLSTAMARNEGVWGCSGISWTICKQSANCSTQITTPVPHQSIIYRLDALPDAVPTASKHWSSPATINTSTDHVIMQIIILQKQLHWKKQHQWKKEFMVYIIQRMQE